MKKIKLFLTFVLAIAMVISGMTTNMIQNVANVKAETDDEYVYNGETYRFYYRILNDGTIKITDYVETEVSDTVGTDCLNVPSTIDGKDVTCIGSNAFHNCNSYGITTIDIPDSVTTLESYAFDGVWSVNIPSGIKSIGSWAFSGCGSLSVKGESGFRDLKIPQGITKLEEGVFSNCTWLEEVVIPSGVTSIGNQAFDGCSTLKSITIPDTVKSIGAKAFYNCTELTKIKIPVDTIVEKDAFDGCVKLKIEYYETEKITENTTTSPIVTTALTTKMVETTNVSVGKTSVKKVTKKFVSKKAKIKLKKVNGAKYQIKISTARNFKKKKTITKNIKKAIFIIKNKMIQNKKTLYVKARAYRTVDRKTFYGKWSRVKKVIIKK